MSDLRQKIEDAIAYTSDCWRDSSEWWDTTWTKVRPIDALLDNIMALVSMNEREVADAES